MKFILAPAARDDLDELHAYIGADNLDAADRVQEAAFTTFALLVTTPGLGRARHFQNSLLTDLRSFGVSGYPNYVIFYRVRVDAVEIIRVLQGAQKFDAIFGEG